MRAKAVIAYDGSLYQGFQRQKTSKNTISSSIEIALRSLHIHSNIVGSGRTDAGVHASAQVIHFDLPEFWTDMHKLKCALNRKLTSIYFKHISLVKDDFHARFSAKKRLYRYVFKTKKPSVFEKKYIAYYHDFHTSILKQALALFEGKHDFDYFHKTGTITHSTVREIYTAKYLHRGDYHYIYFQANGFLRAQVRMMIESAMHCAKGKTTLNQIQEQLKCQKKHHTKLAPPEGLYLGHILY
ncbi:MAG: tRNA pseudouridine(38-40) synthase TruA [Epsilonproteobacteria bacterium]|nr:MAG: tRNA pseudouridine(38-40) synthase TruA [Campylobacterota bacterium]